MILALKPPFILAGSVHADDGGPARLLRLHRPRVDGDHPLHLDPVRALLQSLRAGGEQQPEGWREIWEGRRAEPRLFHGSCVDIWARRGKERQK